MHYEKAAGRSVKSLRMLESLNEFSMDQNTDVIIVGAGLAGLVAAAELADAGKRVLIVDQEPEQNMGGQAFWSFGGLFLVELPRTASPENS